PTRIDAFGAYALHGRRDDVDFLASDRTAVTGVRIQAGDGDPRRRVSCRLQITLRDPDRSDDAIAGDRIGHIAQRNVRRDAGSPERPGDIEFADEARD